MNKINIKILTVLCVLVFLTPIGYAAENEYGNVIAWFNNEKATVEDISLKINEPFIVKIDIESNIDGNVYVQLYEPGVTTAYNVIKGPSEINEWIDNPKINSGWKKTYTWTLKPNGEWTLGKAPINIMVSFSKEGTQLPIEFTIANPYILDEQYSGSTPKPTSDPKSTDQPPSSEGSPGFGVVAALMGVAAMVIITKRD